MRLSIYRSILSIDRSIDQSISLSLSICYNTCTFRSTLERCRKWKNYCACHSRKVILTWCFSHIHFTTACPYSTSQLLRVVRKCFAPQRRALFQHVNFQKWSETVSYYLFKYSFDLQYECASHYDRVQCLNISTSKNAPKP